MMDFQQLLLKRRSCRSYIGGRKIRDEDLRLCLEAARLAPSACNSQPWHFYAVSQEQTRLAIAQAVQVKPDTNTFSEQASALIVITSDRQPRVLPYVREHLGADYFSDIDIGICVGHLTLQAADLGLSTCIMGVFRENEIRSLLAIPEDESIRLVVAIGYAADEDRPHSKRRCPAEENVRYIR